MINEKKRALKEKLRQYSLLAPALVSTGIANAQITYHDIEPDILYTDAIVGDNYTDPVLLDLDNDGVYDIKFAVWSSVDSNNGPNKVNLAGVRQFGANGNAIMGYTNLFSASFCSTVLPLYCPYALNENALITPSANFWAVPATNSMGTLVRYFKQITPPNNFVGQWNDLQDKYIGLRFKGGDGNLHYGWIRMDVSKSPASITVKDYAYEMQDGLSIKAGAKGEVGVDDGTTLAGLTISFAENGLSILLNDGNFRDAKVTIINMPGQVVLTQDLHSSFTQIRMDLFEEGIYIVSVQQNGETISKKIFTGR